MKGFLKGYFSNSYKNLVSFFSKNEKLSIDELEEIIEVLQAQVENKKNGGN
jgi:hypothetical protein